MTQTVLLGDEIELIGGGTPKTSIKEYWDGDIPWLSVVDFGNENRWVDNAEKSITEAGLSNSSTKLLKIGDIIISARGTVGELAQLKQEMAFNQSCYGVRAKSKLNQDYLYYVLKNSIADLQRQAHGGVFSTITRETFNHIKITLPDLETQKKIADILGTIDEKIELNRKMNETLEQMGQALFRHYFIDNPEVEKWQVRELGDYLKVERGLSYKGAYLSDDSADMPMINLGSFALDGTYNENNIKYYNGEFKERTVVHPGDLVLANTDMTQDRVVLGTILRTPRLASKMLFTHHVYGLRNLKLPREFIYYLLKRPSFRERAQGFATGTTVLFMPAEAITKLHLKVPPEDLLDRFSNEAHVIFERKEIARIEIQTLTTLRAALLPRLINGRLKV
jgi:type I restriction enzyme S subunit